MEATSRLAGEETVSSSRENAAHENKEKAQLRVKIARPREHVLQPLNVSQFTRETHALTPTKEAQVHGRIFMGNIEFAPLS